MEDSNNSPKSFVPNRQMNHYFSPCINGEQIAQSHSKRMMLLSIKGYIVSYRGMWSYRSFPKRQNYMLCMAPALSFSLEDSIIGEQHIYLVKYSPHARLIDYPSRILTTEIIDTKAIFFYTMQSQKRKKIAVESTDTPHM